MNEIIIILAFLFLIFISILDYKKSPYCKWCDSRHRGRCIFNPRAGRFLSNINDGKFDFNDPNE